MRQVLISANSSEHVAWFKTGGGAGGSGRQSDIFERHQQALTLHVRKAQIHTACNEKYKNQTNFWLNRNCSYPDKCVLGLR